MYIPVNAILFGPLKEFGAKEIFGEIIKVNNDKR